MFKFLSHLFNKNQNEEPKFGAGSNINLRNLYRHSDYEDGIVYNMNILYQCRKCNMQFRRGYMLLNSKNEDKRICPYCGCSDSYEFKVIEDMDIMNTNLATAPKYSRSESLQIRQVIIDYKVSKVNDKQLETYIIYHQNKLNNMYDTAIQKLEEVKSNL